MFCRECGQPISEADKFCEKCGAKTSRGVAVQAQAVSAAASAPTVPVSEERGVLISSGMRFLPLVGLVAGILCLVAIFTPWARLSVPIAGISADATAWDCVIGAETVGGEFGVEAWACLALSGAVAIILGSLLALATPKAKVPWGVLGIVTGGLLSLAGAFWALADIDTGSVEGVTVTYGFGLYLGLAGGIVACIAGVMGLSFDTDRRNGLADIPKWWFLTRSDVGASGVPVRHHRLVAAIALAAAIVAKVGTFAPWVTFTAISYSSRLPDVHESYSIWGCILHTEGRSYVLVPQAHDWFLLVGALVALVGALASLAVPRFSFFWAVTATGAVLTLVGAVWSLTWSVTDTTVQFTSPYFVDSWKSSYGVYLTLIGSAAAGVGGLLGLVMMTGFYRRRVLHTP